MTPELIRKFEDRSWPLADWHHRQHLTVALWYLRHFPFEEALLRVREGIQAYNTHHGIKMTKDGGYHDSMTIFFVHRIRQVADAAGPLPFEELVERVVAELGDLKASLREYYSRDRIMSWEARSGWVEPDLKPLLTAPATPPIIDPPK